MLTPTQGPILVTTINSMKADILAWAVLLLGVHVVIYAFRTIYGLVRTPDSVEPVAYDSESIGSHEDAEYQEAFIRETRSSRQDWDEWDAEKDWEQSELIRKIKDQWEQDQEDER